MFELIIGVAIGALLLSGGSNQRHGGGYQPKKCRGTRPQPPKGDTQPQVHGYTHVRRD
jgi:hypothetical protein